MKRWFRSVQVAPREALALWRMERRVKAGDAEAITQVQGWSAEELEAKFRLRAAVPFLLGLPVWAAIVVYLFLVHSRMAPLALVSANFLGGVNMVLKERNRRSPIPEIIQDPNWINLSAGLERDYDEANLRRLLALVGEGHPFSLTSEAEIAFQKRLKWYLKGTYTSLFEPKSGGILAAEVLAAYGRDEKSGELLRLAVNPANSFRPAAPIVRQLREFRRQFEARQLA